MKSFLMIIGLILLSGSQVFAWGALAHKASAKVAWSYLDKNTQEKVTQLLNGGNVSDAAVWADAARPNPEWKFTIWYHFEKAPDNYTYLENLKRQDDKTRKLGGLLEALYVAEDTLKDKNSSAIDKENAVKFVIHFVGDIHQPLHTGRVEDNSGNKIPIKWLGLDTNLHSVWDSQMIYLAHKDIFLDQSVDQSTAYANFLLKKYLDLKPTPDLFVRYDDWMHESMLPRKEAYDFKDESEINYTNRFIDVVDKRVYMAGLRIAFMLRKLVNINNESAINPMEELRKHIVDIVGDFTKFVSLKPKVIVNEPEPIPQPPVTQKKHFYRH